MGQAKSKIISIKRDEEKPFTETAFAMRITPAVHDVDDGAVSFMLEGSLQECCVCKDLHLVNNAVDWCIRCKEGVCRPCSVKVSIPEEWTIHNTICVRCNRFYTYLQRRFDEFFLTGSLFIESPRGEPSAN